MGEGHLADLTSVSGLPMVLAEGGTVEFGSEMREVEPVPRTLDEMRDVLWNQTAAGPPVVYLMYRGVGVKGESCALSGRGLRYDVTVIRWGDVGGEYPKTFGHYHPRYGGTGLTYPEVYEVLHGTAHLILQRPSGDDPAVIEDVVVVEAKQKERVVIPPGYGHVTVNPASEYLVMANVVGKFQSDYRYYKLFKGATYYELPSRGRSGSGTGGSSVSASPIWVRNDRYRRVPPPRLGDVRFKALAEELGMTPGVPMYALAVAHPEIFDWLANPTLVGWDEL